MSWNVNTMGTGPVSLDPWAHIKDDIERWHNEWEKKRRKELRSMRKAQLIDLIIEKEEKYGNR